MRCVGRRVRAVLDPGVLVSALIAPAGIPAKLLEAAQRADFELVVSPLLLEELERVLLREKFRRYVGVDAVEGYLQFIKQEAIMAPDPSEPPPMTCVDPDDDYLLGLAYSQKAILVSGDLHLLEVAGRAPVRTPREFLEVDLRG